MLLSLAGVVELFEIRAAMALCGRRVLLLAQLGHVSAKICSADSKEPKCHHVREC